MNPPISGSRISAEDMERRRHAVEQPHAANVRPGYTYHPRIEAVNDRFIRGNIDLAILQAELLAIARAGR